MHLVFLSYFIITCKTCKLFFLYIEKDRWIHKRRELYARNALSTIEQILEADIESEEPTDVKWLLNMIHEYQDRIKNTKW